MSVLGLDISTSCTGWCVFNENVIQEAGFINLSKHKTMFEKAGHVKSELLNILIKYPLNKIVVEENLQAFRPGLSSAKTLMTLAQFNGIVRWICHDDLKIEVESINVNTARKIVGLKIDRKSDRSTKDQVHNWVCDDIESSNTIIEWPYKILKSGPRKGQRILDPAAYDMSDAYVICKAGMIL